MGTQFPYGTFLINCSGCFLIGLIVTLLAAEVYRQVLDSRLKAEARSGGRVCDFCADLRREEEARLHELVESMKAPSFVGWMRQSGTLCLWHAERLTQKLPMNSRRVVAEILARTAEELQKDLEKCAVQAKQGQHSGGGVLGRAAEFLVCQRGIPGEETPC